MTRLSHPLHSAPPPFVSAPLMRVIHLLVLGLVALGAGHAPSAHAQPSRPAIEVHVDTLGGEVSAAIREYDTVRAQRAQQALRETLETLDELPSARARARYHLARAEEHFGTTADAISLYRQSLEDAPSSPTARHARSRLRNLEARSTAGPDDETRRRLSQIRSQGQDVDSADEARDEIARMLEQTSSPSLQAELHFWLASHALFRTHEPRTAWENYAAILQLPDLPDTTYRNAIDGIIETCGDAWRIEQSRTVVMAFVAARPDFFEPAIVARLHDEFDDAGQRRVAKALSWSAFLALAGALGYRRAWRALRWTNLHRWRPWRTAFFLGWFFVGIGFFAEAWDGPIWIELAIVGTASYAIALAAGALHWAHPEQPLRGGLRWALALIIVLASFGAIFLPLEKIGREQLLGL